MSFRFEAFGREITNRKKFEEGIFSDLRNLKCDNDAVLEQPKSEFLDFLYRNNCVRTQKKQKIFFWFSVNHDRLFQDALERDLKKEMANKRSSTTPVRDPALSFQYDSSRTLHDQLPDIIEKFPRPLAELADASSVMSNVTLPTGHLIQIPPHFYPNPMQAGYPGAPPEMKVPVLMNQPPVLHSSIMNPYTAGQEMGFSTGAESLIQSIHHGHPMMGMQYQAGAQGMPIQDISGAYSQQFQMPISLQAPSGIPMNPIPVSYPQFGIYQQQQQQQLQAQAFAQAQAVAAAQAQIQQHRSQLQHHHQQKHLPKVTEVEEPNQQDSQSNQSNGSEELTSDFPLDYVPQVEDDQLFDSNGLISNDLPDRSLIRNVSSEPLEYIAPETSSVEAEVSHDHTKLEVMYKQNEDGTFVSVLVPNGVASSISDHPDAVNIAKRLSLSSESQVPQSFFSTSSSMTSANKRVSSSPGDLRTRESVSPGTRRDDSTHNLQSALLPKTLKSKISKGNLPTSSKPQMSSQQRAVSGAIAAQLNSTNATATNTMKPTTQNTNSQESSGPTFFMPTPSESGCSEAMGYQQDPEVVSSPASYKPVSNNNSIQSQNPQQYFVNNQGQKFQYYTSTSSTPVVAQSAYTVVDGFNQMPPMTGSNSTMATHPETANNNSLMFNSVSGSSVSMIPLGSLEGVTMDDFMYLNPDLDSSADFGTSFNWNNGA